MSTTKKGKGKPQPVKGVPKDRQNIVVQNRLNWAVNIPAIPRDNDVYSTAIESGGLISEVGFGETCQSPIGDLSCFNLRPGRASSKFPTHLFGGLNLGDAFASFIRQTHTLPAENSSMILQPQWSDKQATLCSWYKGVYAEAIWVISMACPLGLAPYLEVTAPELTSSTRTKGIRWKPNICPTIAFKLGWMNETAWERQTNTNSLKTPGNPGLALKLTNFQTNMSSEVTTPITFVSWCCITNIRTVGLEEVVAAPTPDWANFSEVSATQDIPEESVSYTLEEIFRQEANDPIDTGQAGAIADTGPGEPDLEIGTVKDESVSAPSVEQAAEKPVKSPSKGQAMTKPSDKKANTKFYELSKISWTAQDVGETRTISVTPYSRSRRGEDFSLAFRKHVFVAGEFSSEGYMTGMEFKIASAKIPGVAGYVLVSIVQDLRYSNTYHVLGGETTTLFVPVSDHVTLPAGKNYQRTLNRPQVFSRTATYQVLVTLVTWNGTTTDTTNSMTVFCRPTRVQYQVATKPRAAPTSVAQAQQRLALRAYDRITPDIISSIGTLLMFQKFSEDDEVYVQEAKDGESPDSVAADVAVTPLIGEVGELAYDFDEDLVQSDNFMLRLDDITLTGSEIVTLPLLPFGLIDQEGAGGDNPIQEKCSRYAAVRPMMRGAHGPSWGNLRLETRLPTQSTADIALLTLPGDMSDEVVTRLFGLDSLLSMAGSSLLSFGGNLLSGAVSSITDATKDIPIVGGLIGGVGNMLGSLLGGNSESASEKTSSENSSSNTVVFGGDTTRYPTLETQIPFPRHIEFLRTLAESSTWQDAVATVMLQLQNATNLPVDADGNSILTVRPWLNMGSRAGFARSVFDRTVFPSSTISRVIILDEVQVGYLISRLGQSKQAKHHRMAMRAISYLARSYTPGLRASFPHTIFLEDQGFMTTSGLGVFLTNLRHCNMHH